MVNHATRKLDIYEVMEKVVSTKSRKDKIKVLQDNNTAALTDVLRGFFDDIVQWNLPKGKPPFEANLPESVPSTLLKQNKQFKYFVRTKMTDNMPAYRREKIFIGVLESVHPKDAELLVNMINKKSPGKGITKKLVQEAFPGLIVS